MRYPIYRTLSSAFNYYSPTSLRPSMKLMATMIKCIITISFFISVIIFFQYQTETTKYFNPKFDPKDVSCYNIPEIGIQTANKHFKPSKNTIFFLETSCKGGLNSRQACAVESAVRAHPRRYVVVLISGPLNDNFKKEEVYVTLTEKLNVEFIKINEREFVKGTPIEPLFSINYLKNSTHPVIHSSNVLRILTLYKYGGLYLDLDVIVIRNFDDLPNNFVVKENRDSVSNGILKMSNNNRIGRNFTETLVRDLAATFTTNKWKENWSGALKRTLQKICNVSDIQNMTEHTCNGLYLLDHKMFFPVPYVSWRRYMKDQQPPTTSKVYTYHTWNALSSTAKIPTNSLYASLAKKYCPKIYKLYGDQFGF